MIDPLHERARQLQALLLETMREENGRLESKLAAAEARVAKAIELIDDVMSNAMPEWGWKYGEEWMAAHAAIMQTDTNGLAAAEARVETAKEPMTPTPQMTDIPVRDATKKVEPPAPIDYLQNLRAKLAAAEARVVKAIELIDRDSLALVAEMAREANAQVWIERIESDDATAVIIVTQSCAPKESYHD